MYPSPLYRRLRLAVVGLVCSTGAAIASYLLYLDLGAPGIGGQGAVLAKVEATKASVKRKAATSFLWGQVDAGTDLYRKDSVQVGPESQAVIRLKDDSVLEIGERSLVIIEDVPPLEMKFVQGSFIVRGRSQDHKVTVKKNEAPKIESIPIRLLKPMAHQSYFLNSGNKQRVVFSWQPASKGRKNEKNIDPVLEVSSSLRFTKGTTQIHSLKSNKSNSLSLVLQPGDYYWRVRAKNLKTFETRPFYIEKAKAPRPVYPSSGTKISRWEELGPVDFRWVIPSKTYPYPTRLELSKSPRFEKKSIVENIKVDPTHGRVRIEELAYGKYYWRLTNDYPGIRVSSPTLSFSTQSMGNVPLVLVSPKAKAISSSRRSLNFAWDFDATGMEYLLELRRKRNKKVVTKKSTFALELSLPAQFPGEYEWRVSALWKKKVVSQSKWRSLFVYEKTLIALRTPANQTKMRYWKRSPRYKLSWAAQDLARQKGNRYQVTIAKNAAFTKGKKVFFSQKNTLEDRKLGLKPGTYYWKVAVVDGSGRNLQKSEVYRYESSVFPRLGAPKNTSPKSGSLINIIKLEGDLVARWASVKDATRYDFTLRNNRGKTLINENTRSPAWKIGELKPGTYTWRVRARDPLGRAGKWTSAQKLFISHGRRLQAPQILGSKVE